VDIRQLQYLAALAREKHFSRAAASCNITQPTLSGRIRQLEQELGVPIVERAQRYHGLTPEGERVLAWARLILDNWQSMQQELARLRSREGELGGKMIVGVIPSALPMVSLLTKEMQIDHPAVEFTVLSQSSEEILRALHDFSIEAGVTYLDNEPVEGMLAAPLYREKYCLFVLDNHPLARRENVTWQEAAREPLCLLTPNMQNRRIIDAAFQKADCRPVPKLESNSIVNLFATVRLMGLASIMPEYFSEILGPIKGLAKIPLIEPAVEYTVGLIAIRREPLPPHISALFSAARRFSPIDRYHR
jgi:DNA-binding transcriptional LysR family regulator